MNISVKDAKDMFEDLVRRAQDGEHVVLTLDGKPVAEIGPTDQHEKTEDFPFGSLPRIGAFKNKELWIAPDFDELGPEWDEYIK